MAEEFLSCSFEDSVRYPDSSSRFDYATMNAYLDDAIASSGASSSTIDAGATGSIDATASGSGGNAGAVGSIEATASSQIIDVPDFDVVLDLTHDEEVKMQKEGLAPKRKARHVPRPREHPPGESRVLEPQRSGVNGGRDRRGRPGGQHAEYYAGLYHAKGQGKAAKRKYIEDFGPPPSKGGNQFHTRRS